MFSWSIFTVLAVLQLSLADVSVPTDKDICGCTKICEEKYASKANPDLKLKNACKSGCHFFYLIVRVPHKIAPPEAVRLAEENCANSCALTMVGSKQQDACMTGCRNGCEFIVSVQPRVKLTIVVEDEIRTGPDTPELEQVLTDPGLLQQLEAHMTSEKTKIPATYFTKLPVNHDPTHGCGNETHVCEGWMTTEPLICACLLIMIGLILMTVYRQKGEAPNKTDADSAPLLPEKTPLQLTV